MNFSRIQTKLAFLITLCFALVIQSVHAGTKPKFLITPRTTPQHTVSSGESFTVIYQVVNNTKITRTLTMIPIQGVTHSATPGFCPNPFALIPNQSCNLKLIINGSTMPSSGIQGGPVICKTEINTNSPDPFLCSQPGPNNLLNIRRGSYTTIDAFPNPLYVVLPASGAGSGTVTITNTGGAPALGLRLSTSTGNISFTTDCSSTLLVGSPCHVTLSASTPVDGQLIVSTTNSNTERVNVHFVANTPDSTLSIINPIPSQRYVPLFNTDGLVMTIQNNGPVPVSNITLGAHAACPTLVVSQTNCTGPIQPLSTCQLTFTSNRNAYVPCEITIVGANAVSLNTFVAFENIINTGFGSIAGLVYRVVGAEAFMLTFQDTAGLAGLAPWWNGGPNKNITTTNDVGSTNTTNILANWTQPSSPQDIAAAICRNQPLSSSWFLPAICDLSSDSVACLNSENVESSLFNNGFFPELATGGYENNGIYWSSTQTDINDAAAHDYKNNTYTTQLKSANSSYTANQGVRCATSFATPVV